MLNADGYMAQQIDRLVRDAASAYRMRVVHDATLEVNGESFRYDYVLMDRFGLLVLEVVAWPGHRLSGTGNKSQWKATRDGEKPVPFENPFIGNAAKLAALRQSVAIAGRRFADEYFTDLVVYVADDVSKLRLAGLEQMKFVEARSLTSELQARHDFAPNPGIIEASELDDLVSLFGVLDRTGSRAAVEIGDERGRPRAWPFGRKQGTRVAIADGVAGVAPVAPRLTADRYPDEERKPVRTGAAAVALLLSLVAIALWLFMYGGYSEVIARVPAVAELWAQPQPQPASVPEPAPLERVVPAVDLETAKAAYQQAAPEQYAATKRVDFPEVHHDSGQITYVWTYVPTDGPRAGTPQYMALTFDPAGQLVGVSDR